jgi:hypothetical protein
MDGIMSMPTQSGNQPGGPSRARKRSPLQLASPMTPPPMPAPQQPFQPLPQVGPDQLARPVPRSPLPMSGMTNGPGLMEALMSMLTGGFGG